VGGDNQPPNIEIVRTLCQILDELEPDSPHTPHETLVTHVTDRPGHDRRYDIDITRIRSELDWSPTESLATGLLKTVRWYMEHPEWVAGISDREDYGLWVERNYGKR
jgi:dTDP-glucose 4,6-dehydratase